MFDALTIAAAIGCALAAGNLAAFSTFALAGLLRLPPAAGLAAMRSINVTAVTPPLMITMFGTGALALGLGAYAVADGRSGLVPLAAAVYVVGTLGVTAARNVPLNDRLETGDEAFWLHYARVWRAWNHVRVVAGVAAAALLIAAVGS